MPNKAQSIQEEVETPPSPTVTSWTEEWRDHRSMYGGLTRAMIADLTPDQMDNIEKAAIASSIVSLCIQEEEARQASEEGDFVSSH